KVLGIYFTKTDLISLNFNKVLTKLKSKLLFYQTKTNAVSIFSRCNILNTFILPVLWYQLKVLTPPDSFFKEVNKLCEDFIWGGKKHWLKKCHVYVPKEYGGIGVHNARAKMLQFRVKFVNKILKNDDDPSYFLLPFS